MYSVNIPHKNRNSLNLAWQYLFHYFSKYRSIDKLSINIIYSHLYLFITIYYNYKIALCQKMYAY